MNTFIRKLAHAVLFSAVISSAFANICPSADEQICPSRLEDNILHYGLPGWERIDSYSFNSTILPKDGRVLNVSLLNPLYPDNKINFGGTSYDEVTITNSGRIYLGRLPKDYDYSDGARGYIPFLEMANKLKPVSKSYSIGVKWQTIDPQKGFAVIEIGPFEVAGIDHPVSYQAYLYMDGEIQFQTWVDWDNVANYTYNGQYLGSPLGNLNKDIPLSPRLYNGGHDIKANYAAMKNTHPEPLVFNGQLRPGWIAKSFDGKGVYFSSVEGGINVDFGETRDAGGLFAFDHSREHPVVGSFAYVTFDAHSITYGEGKTEDDPVKVYLWYFGTDNGDLISKASQANYPYFLNGPVSDQEWEIYNKYIPSYNKPVSKDKKFSYSNGKSVIWPVAYTTSWDVIGNDKKSLEMTKAIAFKFQVKENPSNRAIQIRNISYGLRQLRSVRFMPPKTHTLSFESDGLSYLKGSNFSGKLPYKFVDGASLYSKIVPAPGDTIDEIKVNGVTVYKHDESMLIEDFVSLPGDGSADLKLETLPSDVNVSVTSKKCETRNLSAVDPSYVKTEVFFDPENPSKKMESYAVKDGLGRVVQTQSSVGNGNFNVSATYFDDFGNVEFAPMSYRSFKSSFSYEDMFCKKCIERSSAYYNGDDELDRQQAFGVPYAKQDYHYGEDNGVTMDASGVAEASFALGQEPTMQWTIPLKTSDYSNFLSELQLDEKVLTEKYAAAKRTIVNENANVESWIEYNFKLVVNRSAEGEFTQQIFDANGNILFAWAKSGNHTVISRTHYNSDNQVDATDISVDGAPFILATTYTYDDAGRVKTVTTPDKGTVVNMYNADDEVRFTRDARQQALSDKLGCNGNYFSTIEYDSLGRVEKTGEVHCGHSFSDSANSVSDGNLFILSENFYGKPTIEELLSTHVTNDTNLLQGILDSMGGILPNDVGAVVSYDGSRVRSDNSIRANSLKMSSYNRLGQKVKQWTIYGLDGAPATQASFEYNVSGDLIAMESAQWKDDNWSPISSLAYYYDGEGRLKSVLEDGDSLMRIDRTMAGTVSKTAFFDRGEHVYDKTYAKDIYGRTTRVDYKNSLGKTLYSESATYPSFVAGRLATAQHVWDGYSSNESYSYDKQGRLTGYTTDNGNIGSGAYGYDGLGRLTSKREGRAGNDTTISYNYDNDHFRPLAMTVGGVSTAFYVYDPSGNVWLDKNSKNSYTINALGLPSRVRLFSDDPISTTYNEVQSNANLNGQIGHTDMAYDEGGRRIWTRFVVGAPAYRTEVTFPGIGEYTYFGQDHSDELALTRVDLVGGGFRTGLNGEALFPVRDLQGSIRGYANKNGLKSAFGYRPYGTTVDLAHYVHDGDERWQGKEFDGEHGKYYFGARFYDPFFGMWISPDPAGQFANPYSYGGDPLNYIDPTGMWALGLGLVVGYDESHGWSFGFGAAAEIGDFGVNASFTFNQDGSKSLSLGANASIPVLNTGLWLNGGASFTMNTYTGASFSRHAGACYGASSAACAGVEVGQGFAWDRSGGFNGMTIYAEAYATYAGVRVSAGYEHGFFGAEGRGLYAGVGGYGLHAQVAQNGGASWGFEFRTFYGVTDEGNELAADNVHRKVSRMFWIPELGNYGRFKFGGSYDETKAGIRNAGKDAVLAMVEAKGDGVLYRELEKDYAKNNDQLSPKMANRLNDWMLNNGMESVWRLNLLHPEEKRTYRAAGSSAYGNIEIMYGDGYTYSSYNHADNLIDHFFLDMVGYWFSN